MTGADQAPSDGLTLRDAGAFECHAPGEGAGIPEPLRSALPLDKALYVVLDAARTPNLKELLETRGVPHACLFSGEAETDLGRVAPWIAELDPQAAFTRQLFTGGPKAAPWELWQYEPGVVLATDAPIDAVRAHMRRFNRISDTQRRWFSLRMFEPDFLSNLMLIAPDAPILRHLFFHRGKRVVSTIAGVNRFGIAWTAELGPHAAAPTSALQMTPQLRQQIAAAHEESANRRSAQVFIETFPDALPEQTVHSLTPRIRDARAATKAMGITGDDHIGTFILLSTVHMPNFYRDELFHAYWTGSAKPPVEKWVDFLAVIKVKLAREPAGWDAWW